MQHQPHALLIRDLLAPQKQHAARDLPHDLSLDARRVPNIMQRLPCPSPPLHRLPRGNSDR